ncbi:hypothetical protein LXL04_012026 [Taraxacum kok-saghyz]
MYAFIIMHNMMVEAKGRSICTYDETESVESIEPKQQYVPGSTEFLARSRLILFLPRAISGERRTASSSVDATFLRRLPANPPPSTRPSSDAQLLPPSSFDLVWSFTPASSSGLVLHPSFFFHRRYLPPTHSFDRSIKVAIFVSLRDSHAIAQVNSVTGSKLLRIIKAHEDLYDLIKKSVATRKYLERKFLFLL